MKQILLSTLLLIGTLIAHAQQHRPAAVILTAGQSNADGRVAIEELPSYIRQSGYHYCQWSYGSGDYLQATGTFEPFAPRVGNAKMGARYGFDAIVYHELEKWLQRPFYVIKQTMGGTSIDTLCSSTHGKYWSAHASFLAATTSAAAGGRSLLKAFTEQIDACIDGHLSKLKEGYDIKAMLWHQGESDQAQADRYYDNLKAVARYVRHHLVQKTGQAKYARLPIICGTFNTASRQGSQQVVQALRRIAAEDPNFHVVDASTCTLAKDQIHFDAAGAEQLGRGYLSRLLTEAEWVQAPTFSDRRAVVAMRTKGYSTRAIQKAIDKMSARGGGTVVIPRGVWTTGRIELKSNVNLHLAKGAELHFSGQVADYLPAVFTRNEGIEMYSLGACVYANGARNIGITGPGRLVGPGRGCEIDSLEKNEVTVEVRVPATMPLAQRVFDRAEPGGFYRPTFIGLMNCDDVLIEGIAMEKTIFWNIVTEYCDGVTIRGVTIDSKGTPRGDAIDIESTRNVLIEHCRVTTTDDAYTLKAGRGDDGLRVGRPTENVVIRHCYANHSAGGVSIGTEVAGGVRNVVVSDCLFEEVGRGTYLKSRRTRGGGAWNIRFERLHLVKPQYAFFFDLLGSPQWMGPLGERWPRRDITPLTPHYHSIHFRDIKVDSCQMFLRAKGLPERPIDNVTFDHVEATGNELMRVADMDATFSHTSFNGLTVEWQ